MVSPLVFLMTEKKLLDRKDSFGGNVFNNPDRYANRPLSVVGACWVIRTGWWGIGRSLYGNSKSTNSSYLNIFVTFSLQTLTNDLKETIH